MVTVAQDSRYNKTSCSHYSPLSVKLQLRDETEMPLPRYYAKDYYSDARKFNIV